MDSKLKIADRRLWELRKACAWWNGGRDRFPIINEYKREGLKGRVRVNFDF